MVDLKTLELTKKTLEKFLTCFKLNNSPKSKEKVEWQFFKNTEKSNVVDIVYDEENQRTAAIYAVSNVKVKVNNEIIKAAQSLDTITDINYRKQGLFVKTAKSVYEKAYSENIAFIYGFPNGNSIYGFQNKLDWMVLDPVPFLIKPLRTKYFFNKFFLLKGLPDFKISFTKLNQPKDIVFVYDQNFPDEVDSLWTSFSCKFKVGLVRNKHYLNWRYLQKPNEEYKIIHAYSNSKEYLGFIVFTLKKKHGGKIGYIMELMFDPNNKQVGKYLLKKSINELKLNKADCILSWCFKHSFLHKFYRQVYFFNMPEKLRPIELHFGALSLNKKYQNTINERSNWFISYSDSDTV